MKILFNCPLPFALAHGGMQTQIEQTQAALLDLGLEVEPLRWWDDRQRGDLIHHFFGRPPAEQIKFAQQKKIRYIIGELLTGQGSRSGSQLWLQKIISRSVERLAPRQFTTAFNWDSYRLADGCDA